MVLAAPSRILVEAGLQRSDRPGYARHLKRPTTHRTVRRHHCKTSDDRDILLRAGRTSGSAPESRADWTPRGARRKVLRYFELLSNKPSDRYWVEL